MPLIRVGEYDDMGKAVTEQRKNFSNIIRNLRLRYDDSSELQVSLAPLHFVTQLNLFSSQTS